MTYDAATRITAADALQHPYFAAAPLPSANALMGPLGERAGPYPRRAVEPLAVAAQRKRKAEEEAAAAAAVGSAAGPVGPAGGAPPAAPAAAPFGIAGRGPMQRPGVLVPGAGTLRRTAAAPPPARGAQWD